MYELKNNYITVECERDVWKIWFLNCFYPCHSGGSGAQRWISREAVLHVAEPAVPPEEVQ